MHCLRSWIYIYHTLSIWLQTQFSQRYRQIKDRKPNIFLNIFGSAWPWDPRGPGTYSKFLQSPLMIDLWMEECQILMIFPYFSWKCRRSSAQDYALNTHTSCFVGCSPHVCLKKYKDSWVIIFCMTKYCVVLAIMDMASAKSDVNGAKTIVCFWRLWIKKWPKTPKLCFKNV